MNEKLVIRTFPLPVGDDVFLKILNQRGINVVDAPMIETKALDFELNQPPDHYQWLIFTSKNAIMPFFKKIANLSGCKIAVIGDSTAEALKKNGHQADFIGSGHSGARFAEEFKAVATIGDRVLLAVGKLASNVMETSLEGKLFIHRINVYETTQPSVINHKAIECIESDNYCYIAVSSPSAVDNLMTLLKGKKNTLRFVSIGSVTSAQIRKYGLEPSGEASEQSYEALAQTIISTINPKP
ncbi:uroporphyrinogen-III synthase [Natronoflexus pectinivorans]|uniref:Uroporphyrinogen-III synthase n=1 Tax=Natronoflexus pectinivorans TaxID=682526 RepID=A0A4V2RVZ0_9BACT|nr:uroporphyrinogen-III synthase [Natronoflexus pectinivorans]TCO06134.1 uroporphyrinogen-III synthase [Natronoflexus pectinivorans]